jgi:hypothetical protein
MMADDAIKMEVKGLKEVQAEMARIAKGMTGSLMYGAMSKATLIVQRSAVKDAPVDRGRLRASITPEVAVRANVIEGVVGSNVKYAPYQELGTRPFWPPWRPIYEWALRKTRGDRRGAGALAASVRASIAARGIRAKRFLQGAVEKNVNKIVNLLGNTVGRIVNG